MNDSVPSRRSTLSSARKAVRRACRSFIIAALTTGALSGCGALEDSTTTVRDYTLFLNSRDSTLSRQFSTLVDDFNRSLGLRVLKFSSTGGNSPIDIVTGLELQTGKLGFGGEGVRTERSGLALSRYLFMQIELDSEYVRSRSPSWPGTKEYNELRLLFFHEVGHGFGLGHVGIRREVMYSKVNSTDKDYRSYFEKIRSQISR